MITMKDIKTCSRKGCDDIGHIKAGTGTWYCNKHYRFLKMREKAKRTDKVVPSWEQCEEMLIPCLNERGELGLCPCCKRQMQWKCGADKKRGTTVSLQHNHDGSMCFICTSCNTGHGSSKLGDAYLDLPDDKKLCADCEEIKPRDQFHNNQAKRGGVHNICKDCKNKRDAARYAAIKADPEKRKAYLAKERQRYAAKKQREVLA